jgi:hypothetical protein
VLGLAAAGFTDKEIAVVLCICVRTVRFHFAQGCRSLRARTRSQAVAVATARGLIDPLRTVDVRPPRELVDRARVRNHLALDNT